MANRPLLMFAQLSHERQQLVLPSNLTKQGRKIVKSLNPDLFFL